MVDAELLPEDVHVALELLGGETGVSGAHPHGGGHVRLLAIGEHAELPVPQGACHCSARVAKGSKVKDGGQGALGLSPAMAPAEW